MKLVSLGVWSTGGSGHTVDSWGWPIINSVWSRVCTTATPLLLSPPGLSAVEELRSLHKGEITGDIYRVKASISQAFGFLKNKLPMVFILSQASSASLTQMIKCNGSGYAFTLDPTWTRSNPYRIG